MKSHPVSALLLVATTFAAGQPALAAPTDSQLTGLQAVEQSDALQDQAPRHKLFEHLNINKKGLAIEGYDPVAYFPEGGGKATKGDKKISATVLGVTYRFANDENKQAFLANPDKYEPQYGGWCAWAMADGKGDKVDVDPESFTVEDGKLYLFYDGFFSDTRKQWLKKDGAPQLAPKADKNWARITKPKQKKKKKQVLPDSTNSRGAVL